MAGKLAPSRIFSKKMIKYESIFHEQNSEFLFKDNIEAIAWKFSSTKTFNK